MAVDARTYDRQIDSIVAPVWQNGNFVNREINSKQEAKLYQRELAGIQAQLRAVKHDINLTMKQIRLENEQRESHVSSHLLLGMAAGKKAAKHASARDREHLKVNAHNALVPYENVIRRIDGDINQLNRFKLAIDQAIQRGDITSP